LFTDYCPDMHANEHTHTYAHTRKDKGPMLGLNFRLFAMPIQLRVFLTLMYFRVWLTWSWNYNCSLSVNPGQFQHWVCVVACACLPTVSTISYSRQNIEHSSFCPDCLLPVPEQRDDVVNKLRRANKYELFLAKTEWFRNSYIIPYCVSKFRQ